MGSIAIIPARGGSKRLSRKNVRSLGGVPLIVHPITTARESALFDAVFVSTEDDEIASISRDAGAGVLERPDALADDFATVVDVCQDALAKNAVQQYRPDLFCCIYATAAFISVYDLKESRDKLHAIPEPDVVMGVSTYPIHPYKALHSVDGVLQPVWPEENSKKSQQFPKFVASNGTLYWSRTETFQRNPTFFPQKLVGYELPAERAVDIDTADDLRWAEVIMNVNTRSTQDAELDS